MYACMADCTCMPVWRFVYCLLPACKSVVKSIGLLFNSYPRSICPTCHEDFDPLVWHMIYAVSRMSKFGTKYLESKDSFWLPS